MKKLLLTAFSAAVVSQTLIAGAIIPNKLLSRDSVAYTSSGTTSYLTDGFLTNWKSCSDKQIAINVGEGPSRLFVTWESYGDCAWANYATGCQHSGTPLRNFEIQTSANSTDGTDGDWTVATTVSDNPVMSRGVYIDFDGMSWVRIVSDENPGSILEVEAFDMSNGGNDTWFFMGTSISQMGLKQQETDTTTADIIHSHYSAYTPAMLRGGIGCINSTDVVNHINDYLAYAGNVHFWAIEMGTNDAWGGGDWNLDNYVKNMQTIIDSAKAHSIEPVLARIIATNESVAGWQVNQKYLDAVDSLVAKNGLHKGPDFYSYFLEHPELISSSDGVHPDGTAGGGLAMHHLWAEALAPLYAASVDSSDADSVKSNVNSVCSSRVIAPVVYASDGDVVISGLNRDSYVSVLNVNGVVCFSRYCKTAENIRLGVKLPSGIYFVVVRDSKSVVSSKVVISE